MGESARDQALVHRPILPDQHAQRGRTVDWLAESLAVGVGVMDGPATGSHPAMTGAPDGWLLISGDHSDWRIAPRAGNPTDDLLQIQDLVGRCHVAIVGQTRIKGNK